LFACGKGVGHEWPQKNTKEYRELPAANGGGHENTRKTTKNTERQATDIADQHGFKKYFSGGAVDY